MSIFESYVVAKSDCSTPQAMEDASLAMGREVLKHMLLLLLLLLLLACIDTLRGPLLKQELGATRR